MIFTTRHLTRSYNEGIASFATPINISSNSSGSFSFTIDTNVYNGTGSMIIINNNLGTANVTAYTPSTYGSYYIPITATQQAYGNYTSGTATAVIQYYIYYNG